MTTTYNGYESYDHWNTALWLNNDESMYNLLINETEKAVYMEQSLTQTVTNIMNSLPSKTPDDAEWQRITVADLVAEHYQEMLQYS